LQFFGLPDVVVAHGDKFPFGSGICADPGIGITPLREFKQFYYIARSLAHEGYFGMLTFRRKAAR